MASPHGTDGAAAPEIAGKVSVFNNVVTLFFPSQELDLDCFLITYWWAFLVSFVVLMSICEYVRLRWQVWCDRRRLRSLQEQCKLRKIVHDLVALHGKNSTANATAHGNVGVNKTAEEERGAVSKSGPSTDSAPATANGREAETGLSIAAAGAARNTSDTPPSPVAQPPVRGSSAGPAPETASPSLPPTPFHRPRVVDGGAERGTCACKSPPLPPPEGPPSDMEADSNTSSVSRRIVACLPPSARRRGLEVSATPVSPDGLSTDGDSSVYTDGGSFPAALPFANLCCPRYSADEQRNMQRRRQENENDWLEARRALENTQSISNRDSHEAPKAITSPAPTVSPAPGTSRRRNKKVG